MTSVLNGTRFLYIEPLNEGNYLNVPRTNYCACLCCDIIRAGQPKSQLIAPDADLLWNPSCKNP